jgi:hypothetical protein
MRDSNTRGKHRPSIRLVNFVNQSSQDVESLEAVETAETRATAKRNPLPQVRIKLFGTKATASSFGKAKREEESEIGRRLAIK